jgi:cytochrome c55X
MRYGLKANAAVTVTGLSAVLLLSFGAMLFSPVSAAEERITDPAHQKRLMNLLVQDCGSCHGLRMTGGLGPALLPQALEGKPRENLIALIMMGMPGTAMPPWKPLLSEAEAEWLLDRLIEGVKP